MLNMVAHLIRAVGLACRGHHELVLENLALRQQLNALKRTTSRPQLRPRDRLFGSYWPGRGGTGARHSTRPARHRGAVASQMAPSAVDAAVGAESRRPPGTDAPIRRLVRTMAAANPLWGAPRIHGELGKVGVEVSERTVSRLLERPRRPSSQTRRTFLTNHVATLVSMDFFTVPTLTGRVLFVFVLLAHHRR